MGLGARADAGEPVGGATATDRLYPGTVYHHQLATLGGNVTSFKRFFEISGAEINLKFPPATNQGQTVRTIVTLKRLSGEADMLPQ